MFVKIGNMLVKEEWIRAVGVGTSSINPEKLCVKIEYRDGDHIEINRGLNEEELQKIVDNVSEGLYRNHQLVGDVDGT